MTPVNPRLVRVLTLVSGVLAIVLANIGSFDLSNSVRGILIAIGGTFLAILAFLEHPTTTAKVNQTTTTTKGS